MKRLYNLTCQQPLDIRKHPPLTLVSKGRSEARTGERCAFLSASGPETEETEAGSQRQSVRPSPWAQKPSSDPRLRKQAGVRTRAHNKQGRNRTLRHPAPNREQTSALHPRAAPGTERPTALPPAGGHVPSRRKSRPQPSANQRRAQARRRENSDVEKGLAGQVPPLLGTPSGEMLLLETLCLARPGDLRGSSAGDSPD